MNTIKVEPKKYIKRPLEVEAFQFKAGMFPDDITQFVTCDCEFSRGDGEACHEMTINTLEGEMDVNDGDYIIKGIAGEFYPCKAEIFEKSYQLVG